MGLQVLLTALLEVSCLMTAPVAADAIAPLPAEMDTARGWVSGVLATVPFSFNYNGHPSTDLLPKWKSESKTEKLTDSRTRRTVIYTDPDSKLQVRWVAVEYADFPTVEWTVYFANAGSADTPIISDIRALDVKFERGDEGEFTLHHAKGTTVKADDFMPLTTTLGKKQSATFTPSGGRPCAGVWPYFNLEWPGQGVIVVVGWPGQWTGSFERDADKGVAIRAGQELTHLKLKPGEEIRTPLIVLQFYKALGGRACLPSLPDWLRAQNTWRRWMNTHNLPKPNGKLAPPMHVACSSHQFHEMINANEENQKQFVDLYTQRGLKLDYWWMDAGWYVNNGNWPNTGTWEVDPKRFPKGLKAITDHAHAKGVDSIVWFEPERVNRGTWLFDRHPEWLLGSEGDNRLLDLGNPEALKWLIEHVDKIIVEQGIDLYRQDYNISPLPFWRLHDSPDRQGITENHYVTGYLAYWDELLRRHPNMLIDTCASGGHRNDLETLRRSLPLLRSDYIFEPVGQQGHTYGLALWLPYFGTGAIAEDVYSLRSSMPSSFNSCWDVRKDDLDYPLLRKLMDQWRTYSPDFYGDFYPLTPYSLDQDRWIAWQFDDPEKGTGVIQAFRRAESPYESARFKLQGLEPEATYSVRNVDEPKPVQMTGKAMMEDGLTIGVTEKPGAVVIIYSKVK